MMFYVILSYEGCACSAETSSLSRTRICTFLCQDNSKKIPHRLERSTGCNLTHIQMIQIIHNQPSRTLLRPNINKRVSIYLLPTRVNKAANTCLHLTRASKDNQYRLPINTQISLLQFSSVQQ